MLGLPPLPVLRFGGAARFGSAHWKLGPIERVRGRAGGSPGSTTRSTRAATSGRASAPEPTLLVPTLSPRASQDSHVETLIAWAGGATRRWLD